MSRGLDGTKFVLPEGGEPLADEGGRVTLVEWLLLFKDVQRNRQT